MGSTWTELSLEPRLRYSPGPPGGEGNVPAWGGGGPGCHWALLAHPRKEINIDPGLLRHSLGKPAPRLDFSPGPVSPLPACPLCARCQARPASSQDSPPGNSGTALPTCSLGAGQKPRPKREEGACLKFSSRSGADKARAAPGLRGHLLRPRPSIHRDSVSPPGRWGPGAPSPPLPWACCRYHGTGDLPAERG